MMRQQRWLMCCFALTVEMLHSPMALAKEEERIVGVTIDSVANVKYIVPALANLKQRPTARIVFDEFEPALSYLASTQKIHGVAGVLGGLLDSSSFEEYSLAAYQARTTEYLNTLGDNVDIWEIGNEVNGEWLGETKDVAAKVAAAFDLVRMAGKKTAITLYYNDGCWEDERHEMFSWTNEAIADRIKQDVDYALISYYEDDCAGPKPNWEQVFTKLGEMFPKAKLGFGEVGTKDVSRKENLIKFYYKLRINHPRFVGGYFWWYFLNDMVPETKPLWKTLNDSL